MKYTEIIIIIYCLAVSVAVMKAIEAEMNLVVTEESTLPHDINREFIIKIRERYDNSVVKNSMDTMVLVVKISQEKLFRVEFQYGFRRTLFSKNQDNSVNILEWSKSADNRLILLRLKLGRSVNMATLKLFRILVESTSEYEKIIQNGLRDPRNIVWEVSEMKLVAPPQLRWGLKTEDGRTSELEAGKRGLVWCEGRNGLPETSKMVLRGTEQLQEVTESESWLKDQEGRRIELWFRPRLIDHLRMLRCSSGPAYYNIQLLVMHHPQHMLLEPEPGPRVANDSTLLCTAADGQPKPVVYWSFVRGPANASSHYIINRQERNKLHILKSAPKDSSWVFNCTAWNALPSTGRFYYNRTVYFIIGDPEEGALQINLTIQLVIGLAVAGAIVVFCIVFVIVVTIVRKSCDHASRSPSGTGGTVGSNARNNGKINQKMAPDKKKLQTEEVTLLAPGRAERVPDNMTVEGLPPPPPEMNVTMPTTEHKMMMDGTIQTQPQSQHQHGGEVTYAELGQLPMKQETEVTWGGNCVGPDGCEVQPTSVMLVQHSQQQQQQQSQHLPINGVVVGPGVTGIGVVPGVDTGSNVGGEVIYSQIVGTLPPLNGAANV